VGGVDVFPAYRPNLFFWNHLSLTGPSWPELPGQDSNLDKENQNVIRLGPKALSAKPFSAGDAQLATLLAQVAENLPPSDPELTRVVEAWPELPKHIRAAVLALVQAAR
jgi:hypothetical protein